MTNTNKKKKKRGRLEASGSSRRGAGLRGGVDYGQVTVMRAMLRRRSRWLAPQAPRAERSSPAP
jgi:hypothetical protein